MACFWSNQNKTIIEIPSTEESNNITYYKIKVLVGDFHWTITHRYSEFYDLHNQLVIDHGVSKEILPSKKVIRNKCPIFIENRRRGLEEYLQKILLFLKRTMPKILVDFLHFNVYDIFFLLQDLSSKLFLEADFILTSRKPHYFNTLELYAISEFLKKPLLDNTESRFDISPVLDLCSQLNFIKIIGGTKPYLQSNIIFNKLHFELSPFKELKSLHMKNVSFEVIFSLGNLRNTLVNLTVNNTDVTTISQILQCDVIHKHNLEGSQVNTLFHCDTLITSSNIVKSLSINDPEYISEINQVEDLERNRFNGLKFFIYKKWIVLENLDLSNNNITEIDITISLAPKLMNLQLNDNKISTISNLSHLPNLSHLSLANNLITVCNDLHTKVGNVLSLNMSQNNIVTCKGFSKLYSLEILDLSCNKISDIEEIQYLGELPCLENLVLTGNNVATTVDYRVKVLEFFKDRSKHICLDNEKPSQSELDKVSVLRALRIVKEGKTPDLKSSFLH